MCRIGRGSFWSWFEVNLSTYDKDMRKNDFHVYVPSDLDLTFRSQICSTSCSYVSTKLEVSMWLSCLDKIGGEWRTDGRTECNSQYLGLCDTCLSVCVICSYPGLGRVSQWLPGRIVREYFFMFSKSKNANFYVFWSVMSKKRKKRRKWSLLSTLKLLTGTFTVKQLHTCHVIHTTYYQNCSFWLTL